MARAPIPTWFFALVVVQRGDEFLIVQERKHGQLWYLPAGRAEAGESLEDAGRRETLEEAGIPVRIIGLLRLEHTAHKNAARVRAIFLAEPSDDTPLKSTPDEDSRCARWVTLEQLSDYSLRGEEVRELFTSVANKAPVYPVSVLQTEERQLAADD